MNTHYNFIPQEEELGIRIDKFLSTKIPNLSRTKIQQIIKADFVKTGNEIIRDSSYIVKSEEYYIEIPADNTTNIEAQNIPLNIVYEDDYLIIINKTIGMIVHPGAGNFDNTLVNALMHHYKNNLSSVGGNLRPGIVHRLDKDTSGLLVVAKDDTTHMLLSQQIEDRSLARIYTALCFGILIPSVGKIDINIARSRQDRTKMTVVKSSGKRALTNYKTLETYANNLLSLVECRLDTGRTHQIRVHLKYKGNEVVGDQSYGNVNRKNLSSLPEELKKQIRNFPRQCLHSTKMSFVHPITGEFMEFEAQIPDDMIDLITSLRKLSS
jgi:23S rRNA pseudouridine1911/1915/1917 synthase